MQGLMCTLVSGSPWAHKLPQIRGLHGGWRMWPGVKHYVMAVAVTLILGSSLRLPTSWSRAMVWETTTDHMHVLWNWSSVSESRGPMFTCRKCGLGMGDTVGRGCGMILGVG